MKKLLYSFGIALFVLAVAGTASEGQEVRSLADKLLRIHVIADSDCEEAQSEKLAARDAVIGYLEKRLKEAGAGSKQEVMTLLSMESERISRLVLESIDREDEPGYVDISIETAYANRREYDGFTLPAGEYDCLCIRLGDAKGKNWWCVLYPSLCISGSSRLEDIKVLTDEELAIICEPEEFKYKIFCFELFERIKAFFKGSQRLTQG